MACHGKYVGLLGHGMRKLPYWHGSAFFVLFLMLGLSAAYHPVIISGWSRIQGDVGDTRVMNHVLEHSYRWLVKNPQHSNFWSPPIFFPALNTAAYQDILLGSAPIYWLFRLLGSRPDTAFQLWVPAVLTLNYVAAVWLFRFIMNLSIPASIAGAYLFAFAGMRISQCGHQQLFPQFFSMMAVICLFKIFEHSDVDEDSTLKRRGVWIFMFAASVVLQFYAGFYLGWFFCLGLLLCFAVALGHGETRQRIVQTALENSWMIVLALFLSGLALSWMGYHYIEAFTQTGSRTWEEAATMVPRWKSWLDMGPGNWLFGRLRHYIAFSDLPMEHEHRIGLGIVTLVMCAAGFRLMVKSRWGMVVSISTAVVLIVAFMYPPDWSPWKLVWGLVPGAGAIRAVSRIALLLLIPFSMAVALFINGMRATAPAVLLLMVLCLEQVQTTSAFDKYLVRRQVMSLVNRIPRETKAFYYAPCPSPYRQPMPFWKYQIDAMWAQMVSGVPTINGYSANCPKGWEPLENLIQIGNLNSARIRANVVRWAKLNGIPPDEISIVSLSDECNHVHLDIGTAEVRPFLGSGWSGDEKNEHFSFVWTVGREATLKVPLEPNRDYAMKIAAGPYDLPERRQEVCVRLNGHTLTRFTMNQGIQTYRIDLPSRFVKNLNRIQFTFAYAASPASLGKGSDTRDLSVLFREICFSVSRERREGTMEEPGSQTIPAKKESQRFSLGNPIPMRIHDAEQSEQ